MVLDDIPNMLQQFQELHGTYPLLQHLAFLHPKYTGEKGGRDGGRENITQTILPYVIYNKIYDNILIL